MSMKSITNGVPGEYAEHWLEKITSITWMLNGRLHTWAPGLDTLAFLTEFPDHVRISGLLESSGSSWCDKAFVFCCADCFDPPLYVQFGSSFEDAHESYLDNDESLLITEEDQKDYVIEGDNPTCDFNSDGEPVDADNVKGSGPLTLVTLRFKV
jgi:hypothetical protein